jgi:opacity protein-like surface antigen
MTRLQVSALALAVVAATAGTASAQGLFSGGQWYGKAFGGATWPQSGDFKLKAGGTTLGAADAEYDTGYLLGAAVGYDYTPNVAVELEYAYRDAGAKGDLDGASGTSNAFMMNALYKFNPMGAAGQIQPYIGGGLGIADYKLHDTGSGSFKTDGDLAYQAIAGVAYNFNPSWSINGEVRYFGIDTGRLDGPQGFSADVDYNTIDLLVGATYRF